MKITLILECDNCGITESFDLPTPYEIVNEYIEERTDWFIESEGLHHEVLRCNKCSETNE